MSFLIEALDDSRFGQKRTKLTKALCELIEDVGLISFIPMAVEDKECMAFVLQEIDKANGYIFGGLTAGNESILESAMTTRNETEYLENMADRYLPLHSD